MRRLTIGGVAALVAAAMFGGLAEAAVPVPVAGTIELVHGGPGNQTDPHISGSLVSYTNRVSVSDTEIRYHDLASGANNAIPSGGNLDQLSDVFSTSDSSHDHDEDGGDHHG